MRRFILLCAFIFSTVLLSAQSVPAKWSVKQQTGASGGLELVFTATIDHDWYMYNTEPMNGPVSTAVAFNASNDYVCDGVLTELTPSESKFDDMFGITVKVFHNTAEFVQKITPKTGKAFTVSGNITFQCCSGVSCVLGEDDFEITIPAGATVAGAGTEVTAAPADEPAPEADDEAAGSGLLTFFLIALAAGLGSVFTPCVFPMIPMTVSFFMSGKQSRRAAITRGLIFGASVTLIYTLIGVLAAIFKSADAADVMSSHWIPNLIFAAMFLTFALSFFGAFEITLPSGLANKADQKADSSGYFGSFFVAIALVIVSFSCTGPFVGSILVESMSSGLGMKPILGMFGFGFAMAFPFMLFAFSPSLMKKMPKSGGWLNMVKVVFAFLLLAFSLKYISLFGQYFGWHLISREVFIGIWIVSAILLGMYFLGKLRLSHDSEVQHVSVTRLLFAVASFTFACYLLPGLFGAPLPALSGIVPDPKGPSVFAAQETPAGTPAAAGMGLCGEARYSNPDNQLSYGLPAYHDIQQAIDCGKQQNKPVLLAFKFKGCAVCKKMEATVWSDEQVLDILRNKVVIATLYIDDKTELPESDWATGLDGKVLKTLGKKLRDYQMRRFQVMAQPYYALIGFDEQPLTKPVGECSVEDFMSFLNSGLEKFNAQPAGLTPQVTL